VAGVLFALAASLSWGVSDFMGGLKSRQLSLSTVLGVTYPIGLVIIATVVAVRWQPPPGLGFIPYAAGAGLLGVAGIAALYRGLTVGQMGSVAPIAATGPLIPVVFGLARGEHPSLLQALGMALAFVGVVLVGRERGRSGGQRRAVSGAGLAVAAALCFGCALIALDEASTRDPYWATLVMRSVSTLTVGVALLVSRGRRPHVARSSLLPLATLAALDLAGTCFFAISTTHGLISIVSAITSFPPVVVILLARIVLDERLEQLQLLGALAALAGIVMVSIG
jgi:drug/metabolite transporter (DMT)-like permease